MKAGRWLLMAILPSITAMLIFSSAFGRGQSAVIFDYEVTNDGGILFADEYERLGGVDTLGHPASYRFTLGDGFTYQVTQRALLQWRPEANSAYLGNIFQMLEQAGLDDWLLREKAVPLPIKDDGAGGDWNKAKEARLSWLTNEQIKAKYLANPNPGAIAGWSVNRSIELYGLPMSRPERHGPFISQRFQRVAFQLWVEEVPGSPAPGTVIGVLGGRPAQGGRPGAAGRSERGRRRCRGGAHHSPHRQRRCRDSRGGGADTGAGHSPHRQRCFRFGPRLVARWRPHRVRLRPRREV